MRPFERPCSLYALFNEFKLSVFIWTKADDSRYKYF